MVFPRITTRHLFLSVGILAIYSSLISGAAGGNVVAYALSLSIALLIFPFAIYAACYWVFLAVGNIRGAVPPGEEISSHGDVRASNRVLSGGNDG